MKSKRVYRVLKDCVKQYRVVLILYFLLLCVNLVIFLLYNINTEPFVYSLAVTLTFLLCSFIVSYIASFKKAEKRELLKKEILFGFTRLPKSESLCEEDYTEMLFALSEKIKELSEKYIEEKQDTEDYLTAWVHQIKTPISVIKMSLSDYERECPVAFELFRIEQYVDMVLQYIRLGSETNDLVIKEMSLDSLIRGTIRKFAPQFIGKRLALDYTETDLTIVTDGKWFQCILDQIISNAIKYTPTGTVSISVDENRVLHISDTGIGIAPEDLPRIFEKGYTGINGRLDKHSSGLGLYLAKKSADKLSIPIFCQSTVGKGSRFSLNLYQTADV